MSVFEDFDEIMEHAHFWNWVPDWSVTKEIYRKFPDSYSVLTPFAYTYLEEMIRTTTSDYGLPLFDRNGQPVEIRVGVFFASTFSPLLQLHFPHRWGGEFLKHCRRFKDHFVV